MTANAMKEDVDLCYEHRYGRVSEQTIQEGGHDQGIEKCRITGPTVAPHFSIGDAQNSSLKWDKLFSHH